jgi:hypothetical protein
VRSDSIGGNISGDARTTYNQRHIDIFFEAAFLSRLEAVLSNVVPIVGRIYDVSVVKHTTLFQTRNNTIHDLVDSLQGA